MGLSLTENIRGLQGLPAKTSFFYIAILREIRNDIRCLMEASFEKIHSYYQSLNLDLKINGISDKGETLIFSATDHLPVEAGFIYFTLEGSVAISHRHNDLTIGNAIELMPIGLMERYCPHLQFAYTCMTPVKLIKITYQIFDDIFYQDPEHMHVLSKIQTYMTIFSLELHAERKQPTSYQTIRPMLFRYLYRMKTFPGETEGLASFIIRRTKLSRTHVFRVLADLKEGGYITMKNGKLTSINKNLPEDY